MKVEVNRSAKAYAKQEIVINAPAQKVYSVLSAINEWPLWQGNVKSAAIEGAATEGKEFRWKAGGVNIQSKIHTANPFNEFGWTGRIWWITAVHNWTLEEKNNQSLLTVEESMNGFLSGTMKKSLTEGMIQNLKELKLAAEKK